MATPRLAAGFAGDRTDGRAADTAAIGAERAARGEAFFGDAAFFAGLLRATAFRFFGDAAFLTPARFGARVAFFGEARFFTAYSDSVDE